MNRLSYFDIARGVGIIFIVYGHVFFNDLSVWMYSFHVPLFFIISGGIANHRNKEFDNWSDYFTARVKPFIFPYLFYSLLYTVTSVLVDNWDVLTTIKSLVKILFLSSYGTMWFLPVLVMAELFFFLLQKYKRNSIKLYIFGLVVASLGFSVVYDPDFFIVQTIVKTFVSLGFYAVGYYGFKPILAKKHSLPLIAVCLLVSVTLSGFNGFVDLNTLRFNNVILYFLAAILGSFVVISLSHYLHKTEVIENFGRNSMIVMGSHFPIIKMLGVLVPFSFLQGTVIFLMVLAIEYLLIRFKMTKNHNVASLK